MLFRYKLTTSYDGSRYHGLQIQNHNDNTISKIITDSAASFIAPETKLVFASRTDVGTHAIGQVFHIDCIKNYNPDSIIASINASLAKENHRIVITDAQYVSSSFNARSSVLEKTYLYRIICNKFKPILETDRSWHVYKKLDLSTIPTLLGKFVTAKKDFRGFGHEIDLNVNSLRSLREIKAEIIDNIYGNYRTICATLSDQEVIVSDSEHNLQRTNNIRCSEYEQEIRLYFTAKSFLRHQVRLMVGAIVQSMSGAIKQEIIDQIFLTGLRPTYIITAPASGLYLLSIDYNDFNEITNI